MASEDRDLIKRFQAGEERAFNELVLKYQEQIYQVARRLLKAHQDAEDVSQEVFIRAYKSLKDFRGDSSFFTWIYRITVNLSLNALRKKKLRQMLSFETAGFSIASKTPQQDQQLEKQEVLDSIGQAVEKLPKKQKLVFTLRYHQGLPHAEIARILNRDEGTIRANYHQALRKLQKAVKA